MTLSPIDEHFVIRSVKVLFWIPWFTDPVLNQSSHHGMGDQHLHIFRGTHVVPVQYMIDEPCYTAGELDTLTV